MAKNAPFHKKSPVKNFHGPAKGGASHCGPPPKYATGYYTMNKQSFINQNVCHKRKLIFSFCRKCLKFSLV